MSRSGAGLVAGIGFLLAGIAACAETEENEAAEAAEAAAMPAAPSVERGEYIVRTGGCDDCHTPKTMTAQGPVIDTARRLSGHPAGEAAPPVPAGVLRPDGWGALVNPGLTAWAGPWGISFTANLTPDATGLASWTEEQFVAALRTGKQMGSGRDLLPPMPWQVIGQMTDEDLKSILAYLKTITPIANAVPAPIPPGQ
jgi:cytochrome c2